VVLHRGSGLEVLVIRCPVEKRPPIPDGRLHPGFLNGGREVGASVAWRDVGD
jgi:hypothetical protein